MANTTDEVTIVQEYFPALRRVRVMRCREVMALLDSGRGRLSGRFDHVPLAQKQSFRLSPGRGVQLWVTELPPHSLYCYPEPCTDAIVHAVVLYRGLDGEYCFFDSNFAIAPTPAVTAAVTRSGTSSVSYLLQRPGIQGVGVATCQYHCLAFMSFIVQHPHLPTKGLIREFVLHMLPERDVKAVRLSQEIFREAGIVTDLESAGPRVHGCHQPACQSSFFRQRRKAGVLNGRCQPTTMHGRHQAPTVPEPMHRRYQPTSVRKPTESDRSAVKTQHISNRHLKTLEHTNRPTEGVSDDIVEDYSIRFLSGPEAQHDTMTLQGGMLKATLHTNGCTSATAQKRLRLDTFEPHSSKLSDPKRIKHCSF